MRLVCASDLENDLETYIESGAARRRRLREELAEASDEKLHEIALHTEYPLARILARRELADRGRLAA